MNTPIQSSYSLLFTFVPKQIFISLLLFIFVQPVQFVQRILSQLHVMKHEIEQFIALYAFTGKQRKARTIVCVS